jgi:hypothetical protein
MNKLYLVARKYLKNSAKIIYKVNEEKN